MTHDRSSNPLSDQHSILLELSRDIDRNQADAKFAAQGGNIYYVFDENIFELFYGSGNHGELYPYEKNTSHWDKRGFTSLFHKREWRNRHNDKGHEESWISVNRQIAALTSEYIFSGSLPAQYNGQIFVSQWHWRELVDRAILLQKHFEYLTQKEIEKSKNNAINQHVSTLKNLSNLTKKNQYSLDTLYEKIGITDLVTGELIKQDVKRLADANVPLHEIKAYLINRVLIDRLVAEDLFTSTQMIDRIFNGSEISRRISPLYMLDFHPSDKEIAERSKFWIAAIRKEEAEQNKIFRRSVGSVKSDAHTLSYLEVVSNKLDSKQQICFVTGDDLLFDAYRRNWLDNNDSDFILRRPVQYTPLLNARDTDSGVTSSKDIFEKVQMAIEPAMMFFRIGMQFDGGSKEDSKLNNIRYNVGREYMALQLKTTYKKKGIPFLLLKGNEERREAKFKFDKSVADEFRELERTKIGALMEKFAGNRLESITSEEIEMQLKDPKEFSEFIAQKLDSIYENTASHFVPEAMQSVNKWLLNSGLDYDTRVPIVIDLDIPLTHDRYAENLGQSESPLDWKQGKMNMVDFVDQIFTQDGQRMNLSRWRVSKVIMGWIKERPSLVFSFACVVALRLRFWEEAADYSEIAMKAARRQSSNIVNGEKETLLECTYLRGVAQRFNLANTNTNFERTRPVYESVEHLHRDIISESKFQLTNKNDNESLVCNLQTFRSLSEIGSLLLFKITSGTFEDLNKSVESSDMEGDYKKILIAMAEAVEIFDEISSSNHLLTLSRAKAFETTTRQTLSIIASAYCLGKILLTDNYMEYWRDTDCLKWASEGCRNTINSSTYSNLPKIVSLEMHTFLYLFENSLDSREAACDLVLEFENSRWSMIDKQLYAHYKKLL